MYKEWNPYKTDEFKTKKGKMWLKSNVKAFKNVLFKFNLVIYMIEIRHFKVK